MTTTNTPRAPHTAYRIPALVALAFECANPATACELLFAHVDAGLASDDIETVDAIRCMVARVCHWLADSGIEYGAADEECLLGYLDALADHGAACKVSA